MCGIFCSIWHNNENADHVADYVRCKCKIEQRGPDYLGERSEDLSSNWKAFFAASVLWMQGPQLFKQPCVDSDGNILLWNGDIFSGDLARNDVSDTQTLQNVLQASQNIPDTLTTVRGPYSVVYYQAARKTLYFARDPIGRHSLLLKVNSNCDRITMTSSANGHLDEFFEVPAVGVFAFGIENSSFTVYPWFRFESRSESLIKYLETRLAVKMVVGAPLLTEKRKSPILEPEPQNADSIDQILCSVLENTAISCALQNNDIMRPKVLSEFMKSLSEAPVIHERIQHVLGLLKQSIKLRVEKKSNYCKNCIRSISRGKMIICDHAKLGILFSGGLDSTILAALADEFVSRDESIDLINVAFEKAKKVDPKAPGKNSQDSSGLSAKFDAPDRKTGRQALAELQTICPWRTWNFIECNVTQQELQKYRSSRIRDLVYPLSTILDDDLGCALWFASRASGVLLSTGKRYDSPSRVLLLGMGADELFGGYMRHRTTLRRCGWSAVSEELNTEFARISERNLGRDDRVVSDHGRQSRLPYLDEDFVEYVTSLHASERCNPTENMPAGLGDKLLLRLVAYDIGLHQTANFPKRAFQFGSRIANSKENARELSKWL